MKATRPVLALALTLALVAGVAAQASKPVNTKIDIADTALRQKQLKVAFEAFYRRLAIVTNRMENGSPADKARAESLRKALKLVSSQNTEAKFDALINALRKKEASESLDILQQATKDIKELRTDLKKILALLLEEDPGKDLAKQLEKALALLGKLKEARNQQARLQAQTENGKQQNSDLAKMQDNLEAKTRKILESGKDDEKELLDKVRKPIEKATGEQGKARNQLGKNDRDSASDSQGRAVGYLDQAIREIEEIIRQNRREEHQRKLNDLLSRCKRMLQMQQEVRDGSVTLERDIRQSDNKPTLIHATRANKLSDQEMLIVREAESALKMIRDAKEVFAFLEAFEQVEKDTDTISKRLAATDLSTITLQIEDDVIEQLKDMIRALQQAINDTNDNSPPPPISYGPTPDGLLVDVTQELKMIRAMQGRIRARTELYAKHYQGEQAPRPENIADAKERSQVERVQKELKELAGRQERLAKVTRSVSEKANRQRGQRID